MAQPASHERQHHPAMSGLWPALTERLPFAITASHAMPTWTRQLARHPSSHPPSINSLPAAAQQYTLPQQLGRGACYPNCWAEVHATPTAGRAEVSSLG